METILARIEQNMQTKQESKSQLDEFKTTVDNMAKAFNEKIDEYKTETDKKYAECQDAIRDLKKQLAEMKQTATDSTREGGVKRPCNSATRATSADTSRVGSSNSSALRQDIQEKIEKNHGY